MVKFSCVCAFVAASATVSGTTATTVYMQCTLDQQTLSRICWLTTSSDHCQPGVFIHLEENVRGGVGPASVLIRVLLRVSCAGALVVGGCLLAGACYYRCTRAVVRNLRRW